MLGLFLFFLLGSVLVAAVEIGMCAKVHLSPFPDQHLGIIIITTNDNGNNLEIGK